MALAPRLASAAFCILAGIPAFAQNPVPDAARLLEASISYMKGLRTCAVDGASTLTHNKRSPSNLRFEVRAQMPDKVLVRTKFLGSTSEQITIVDGANAITSVPATNQYRRVQLDEPLLRQFFSALGTTSETRVMMNSARFVGLETRASVPCNHLTVDLGDSTAGEVWIASTGAPLPVFVRFRSETPLLEGESELKWVVNPEVPANTFEFSPPADAKEVPLSPPSHNIDPGPLDTAFAHTMMALRMAFVYLPATVNITFK